MKNTFGNNISITLFGESHGEAIGAVLDGIPAGIAVDIEFIKGQLLLRRPVDKISTPRAEADNFQILSGVFNGKTTGSPICIIIPNENIKSEDYSKNYGKARPGHADYTAFCKYNGFEDYRGGGHFSGRITAAIVAAGAIAISALNKKDIYIGSHILRLAGINDTQFSNIKNDIIDLSKKQFAVLNDNVSQKMKNQIEKARNSGDSVGGIIETAIIGMPQGVGEPWFDTLEGMLSHGLFSIPAVKAIEFGDGFGLADMLGSEANDELLINNGEIETKTNSNGGINGGIANGMPIIFRSCIKPTPTISKEQNTIDFIKNENTIISSKGRHDPCIVHRARVVIDSITALVICDMLATKFGIDWLAL